MNKKDREQIFQKYGGRCAYCGCELTKGWHISKMLSEAPAVNETGEIITPNDTMDNKLPSCAKCNMSRTRDNSGVRFASIEDFRNELQRDFEFLKDFPYYQRMLRFGIIKEVKSSRVEFYFETIEKVKGANKK